MLEANFLTILLAPNYEKPVDTAQDILDQGLTVITTPGRQSILEGLKNSSAKIDRDLAEITIVPEVIFCFFEIIIILSFPKRIGMNLMDGLKIRF